MVEPKILSIQFNQDQGCFALGTETGYSIWNSEPITELCRRDVGGVRHVCLLQRTSIVALVGGGRNPFDSPNKVVLWDDVEGKSVCHMEFRLPVLAVRRRTNVIVISTLNNIYVYKFNAGFESSQFAPPVLIDTIHTTDNPKGILCMSYNSATTKTTLAFPASTIGHAYIMGLRLGNRNSTSTSTATEGTSSKSKPLVTVKAHKSALAALSLSGSGNMLATVSVTGTLVRVFDVTTCEQVFSFRRGIASAEVDCISFNRNETMICSVFDQTMYLFKLAPDAGKGGGRRLVSFAEQYFPRFEQTTSHSFAHVHIPSENSICVFQNDKASLLVVCSNGTARKYRHHDRNIQLSEFHKLLKDNEDSLLKLLRAPEPQHV